MLNNKLNSPTMLISCIIFIVFLQVVINVSSNVSPSVIIVGAGPAGIAAASRLLENNISNIQILEAEGRIGGRIHSVKFGDAVIDLGAQWCHADKSNLVYQLVKDLDVLEPSPMKETFYHSSHKDIDQNFIKELLRLYGTIYSEKNHSPEGLSIGDYTKSSYNKIINERYRNNPEKLKFASEFLGVLKNKDLYAHGAFSWFEPSAKSDYEEAHVDNDPFSWKGLGFKIILDVLMKKYPDSKNQLPIDDKVILNKEVVKIAWNGNKDVPVECSDNSIYKADHVILTMSLGVLKDRYTTLFHPSLPQEKINAVKELGIAAVVKMFLHFPNRWWPNTNFNSISFFWNEQDKMQLLVSEADHSWLLNLVGLFPIERNPNVLEAWFIGEHVPAIELFSDDKIVDGVMFIVNKFVGHHFQNITEPDSAIRYKWYSNPHFRGTWSYQTVKSRERNVSGEATLSKPLTASSGKQTLLFAGEATNPIHYGTVHGAIETGFREADRIIQLYK